MRLYVLEYDFNLITIHGHKKPSEHRVETFSKPQEFIERVKEISEGTSVIHDVLGEKLNTNIKTYGGTLPEIPLEKVLDPFGIGN